jgi:putative transposase
LPKARDSDQCSAAPVGDALKRCETLRLLAARPRLTTREMDEAASKLGLSRAYLYRLLAAFRKRPRTSTLLPKTEGRKTGTRFVSPEIELIVESAIHSFYLQRIKPPFSALVRQIQADCHQGGFKSPDRKTILRRVSALDERKITASRHGSKTARERYDPVGQSPVITQALERVQIDHTPVDLIVVDEINRKPLGRPWLTLTIDVASRTVCGFFLSMIAPSTISVALALAHSVAPKDLWLADRELSFEWPVSGLPVKGEPTARGFLSVQWMRRSCTQSRITQTVVTKDAAIKHAQNATRRAGYTTDQKCKYNSCGRYLDNSQPQRTIAKIGAVLAARCHDIYAPRRNFTSSVTIRRYA